MNKKVVLLTGLKQTNQNLKELLDKNKFSTISLPALKLQITKNLNENLSKFDWIVFTSPNAIRLFSQNKNIVFEKAFLLGIETKKVFQKHYPNILTKNLYLPKIYSINGLSDFIYANKSLFYNKNIIWPCSELADESLYHSFKNIIDIKIFMFKFYQPVAEKKLTIPKFDIIVFFSPSSIQALMPRLTLSSSQYIFCIGNSSYLAIQKYNFHHIYKPIENTQSSLALLINNKF